MASISTKVCNFVVKCPAFFSLTCHVKQKSSFQTEYTATYWMPGCLGAGGGGPFFMTEARTVVKRLQRYTVWTQDRVDRETRKRPNERKTLSHRLQCTVSRLGSWRNRDNSARITGRTADRNGSPFRVWEDDQWRIGNSSVNKDLGTHEPRKDEKTQHWSILILELLVEEVPNRTKALYQRQGRAYITSSVSVFSYFCVGAVVCLAVVFRMTMTTTRTRITHTGHSALNGGVA